ncbi:MAG: type II secretion system F family protein [Rhizobiales bacterium]|nr:type II secretion system F family protein [Hyphomicrobiales bacterium]
MVALGPLSGLLGDASATMLSLLIFLAAAMLAFSIMASLRLRGAFKRRAAGITNNIGSTTATRPLQKTGFKVAQKLIESTARHYSSGDSKDMKVLRRRLVLAGLYDARAVGYFFLARTALAIGLGLAVFFFAPVTEGTAVFWLLVGLGGIAGYLAPGFYVDKRIAQRRNEHRAGFPDFMDLLVVCADAGLSMEAALDRVGRELGESYPSLTINIHMACLEIRAGRTLTDALDHLADRLGLEEARSFATLITQSAELGSSITDALRVYSDDMRHKRLSRAEEKAYSLPAKLSVPMMVCIFPVLFVVILLPVVVRLVHGQF